MTLEELRNKVCVRRATGYGQYTVEITYYGKTYSCQSNNSLAWDRIDDENYRDNEVLDFFTKIGAFKAFYDECKRKNHLGEYKYC